jgi:hypothetical protein
VKLQRTERKVKDNFKINNVILDAAPFADIEVIISDS